MELYLLVKGSKVEVFDEGVRLGCADVGAVSEALADGWLRFDPVPERPTELGQ